MQLAVFIEAKADKDAIEAVQLATSPLPASVFYTAGDQKLPEGQRITSMLEQCLSIKRSGGYFTLDRLIQARFAYLRLFFACDKVPLEHFGGLVGVERHKRKAQQLLSDALSVVQQALRFFQQGRAVRGFLNVLALAIAEGVVGDESRRVRCGLTLDEYAVYHEPVEELVEQVRQKNDGLMPRGQQLRLAITEAMKTRLWPEE